MAHVREVEQKTRRAYEVRWRDGGKFRQRSFTVKREADRLALTVENEQHAGNSAARLVRNTKTLRQVAEEAMNADRRTGSRKRWTPAAQGGPGAPQHDAHVLGLRGRSAEDGEQQARGADPR